MLVRLLCVHGANDRQRFRKHLQRCLLLKAAERSKKTVAQRLELRSGKSHARR